MLVTAVRAGMMRVMADFDFPEDLIQLQRSFYELDARCEEITATHPSARDQVAGIAQTTPEQDSALAAARAERLDVSERLQDHEWWSGVDLAQRLEVKAELRAAAKRAMSDTPGK